MASLLECNTCIVGITLLFASVYMSFIKHDDKHFVKFYDTLNEEQKLIYSVKNINNTLTHDGFNNYKKLLW